MLTCPLTQTFPQRTEGSVKKHWYKVRCRCCPSSTDLHSLTTTAAGYALCRVRGKRGGSTVAFEATDVSLSVHMLTRQKQSAELLAAIKEYDANKWKVVGQKVGKPAKVVLI